MNRIRQVGVLVASLAMVTVANAQNAPSRGNPPNGKAHDAEPMSDEMQGMMQERQGMMHDMMSIHVYAPAALLERRETLGLSRDQVTVLETLAAEVKTAKTQARTAHDTRHARIVEEFKLARPDPARV